MFLDNKYTILYFKIIEKHQIESGGERHHIIPKSLGGSNKKSNIVCISPRVHFILHKLLIKMVSNPTEIQSMNYALFMMMNRKITIFTSRDYDKCRDLISKHMKHNNPMHNLNVLSNRIGQKRNNNTKEKISLANKKRWGLNARPIRVFNCPICNSHIETRIPTKTTCSKKCSGIFQYIK